MDFCVSVKDKREMGGWGFVGKNVVFSSETEPRPSEERKHRWWKWRKKKKGWRKKKGKGEK